MKQPGCTPKQMQKLRYTLILMYKKLQTVWQAHQQEFSYTLILIHQHLKQPSSTSKQVQELSNTLIFINFNNTWNSLAAHQNKCRSWATRWFSGNKNLYNLAALLNMCRSWATRWFWCTKTVKSSLRNSHQQELSYTLILIYQHLISSPHGKTSAEVELHDNSDVQKIKNSLATHQNKCRS